MKSKKFYLLAAALLLTAWGSAIAQSSDQAASERKVVSQAAAVYPDLAKKMHIHGIVRVEAMVKPNGSVKSTRILGGNPVLVDAAQAAVAKWKFEPTQAETTEVLQVTFASQ